MFERFTDRARRAVVLAQEEARLLKHTYIGTEHILLGLIHDEEGVAAKALESLDISLESVRGQVEEIIGPGGQEPAGHIPFTPRAKRVLELSLREALKLRHNYIGTEHILLGLIREGEGVAAQVLVKLGADLPGVRHQVLALLEAEGEASASAVGRKPERIEDDPMAGRSRSPAGGPRVNVNSGGPMEATVGYSRAVRVGDHVAVAGTTTLHPGGVDHPGDCYLQTQAVLRIIQDALRQAGASLSDVVRTRAFLTDISKAGDYGRAHGEVFGDIRPVATLVEVSALVHPDLVVEIEVDAIGSPDWD
ncbi:MAG: hypothetical protein J4F50_07955 [Acidimicrobiia bacterium]|nr:hypothetical protein [Acidimicrobiia bacterium]